MVNTIVEGKSGVSLLHGLGLGHVWVSYRIEGVWSEPRLPEDVSGEPPANSAFYDHCLPFSADENEAFWTSIRPGGFGGNDIWTSRRVNGRWTAPENLGPNVNVAIVNQGELITQTSVEELLAGAGDLTYTITLAGDTQDAYTQISQRPWVSGIRSSRNGEQVIWQVSVTDEAAAKDQLLSLLVSNGLT